MGGRAWSSAPVVVMVGDPSVLVVRQARQDDVRRIVEIERASFADPWTEQSFASALALSHIRFLVAEELSHPEAREPSLLGYVIAIVVEDEGEIADLAVAPAARRRGIGTLLLDRIATESAIVGVSALYLEVRESNVAARALYASRWFLPVGRRRGYYQHPAEDALLLRRDLEADVK